MHRKHLFMSSDLPIMLAVIDTEEQIKRLLPIVEVMVGESLVAISDVEVISYVHRADGEGK